MSNLVSDNESIDTKSLHGKYIVKEVLTGLTTLGVKLKAYITDDMEGYKNLVLVGGLEVLTRVSLKQVTKDVSNLYELGIDTLEIHPNNDVLLPFIYSKETIDKDNLRQLVKYKNKDKLTNDEVKEFVKTKSSGVNFTKPEVMGSGNTAECSAVLEKFKLEDKITYIYDRKPSTNSLALAKQFKVNHKNVMQVLFEIIKTKPHLLNHMHYDLYTYKTHKTTLMATYLEITEDMYHEVIQNMGKPKSDAMKVYRHTKLNEYKEGFQKLRESLYVSGHSQKEIENVTILRTNCTKRLLTCIDDFVIHYNDSVQTNKTVNPTYLSRSIFNLINHTNELNSISYVPTKTELDNVDDTRRARDFNKQNNLIITEHAMVAAFNAYKGTKQTVKQVLTTFLDIIEINNPEQYIRNMCKEYDVEVLLETMLDR